MLIEALEAEAIMSTWVSRDAHSKMAWDITGNSVAVSTIHSAKGMDAKAVLIWGLDALDTRMPDYSKAKALAYVACTRARQHLEIFYCEETPLIQEMQTILNQSPF